MFTTLGVIGGVLLIVVVVLAGALRRTVLGKLLGGVATVMVWVGIVVFLLWTTFLNPHIGMTRTGFSTTSVSIFSHNKVTFENPTDGVYMLSIYDDVSTRARAHAAGAAAFVDKSGAIEVLVATIRQAAQQR